MTADDRVTLHHGDCLDVLRTLPDNSVDAVVTDPPYGLSNTDPAHVVEALTKWASGDRAYVPTGRGFMGKEWDAFVPPPAVWDECLRVLKPGGHLLAFAGSRTFDLMTLSIRFAGFDIRDGIAWLYGSGFPKSLDVSKAIDKAGGNPLAFREFARAYAVAVAASSLTHADVDRHLGIKSSSCYWAREDHRGGMPPRHHWEAARDLLGLDESFSRLYDEAERAVVGERGVPIGHAFAGSTYGGDSSSHVVDITAPATPAAQQWQGWGTALKPSHEPVLCARKPFSPVPSWGMVSAIHHALGGLLWLSVSPAKRAALTSPSSRHALPEGSCASALASAALDTSLDGYDETATYSSPALASTSLSIATSWSAILAALSVPTTTFTTSTASSTTTALRTLNSLLAPITSPTTMPRCECLTDGSASTAPSAGSRLSDEWASWLHTLSRSVPETAIEGIALAVASALAVVAEELSADQAAGSTAPPAATTRADASSANYEPIVVARKPLSGTVAANVLAHGTGALNIDGTRVAGQKPDTTRGASANASSMVGTLGGQGRILDDGKGRWPTNVVMDGDAADALDEQSGTLKSGDHRPDEKRAAAGGNGVTHGAMAGVVGASYADAGGASRFFPVFRYQAKAPARERVKVDGVAHPTVKPLELMRWLVRLVTPPGGVVLEPFAGSGTTVEACLLEGFHCIAIEREATYLPLIHQRIARCQLTNLTPAADDTPTLFDLEEPA